MAEEALRHFSGGIERGFIVVDGWSIKAGVVDV